MYIYTALPFEQNFSSITVNLGGEIKKYMVDGVTRGMGWGINHKSGLADEHGVLAKEEFL